MAVSHSIVHRIARTAPSDQASLTLRKDEISPNGKVEEYFRELKLHFIKKLGKIHGRFSSDVANHPASNWLQECVDEKLSFVSFTHKVMEHLKIELEKTEEVLDAAVFFIQESFEHADELYVYVVYQNEFLYLNGELDFIDTLILDTKTVNLAAKINLREWQDEDQHLNYLSLLIWRGEKELSEVFSNTMGFSDKADTKEQTEKFIEAVDAFTAQMPEEAAVETRETVVNYCLEQDSAGQRVNIKELSKQINDEYQQNFAKHIKKETPQLHGELIPDRGQLKQYIRISGRNDLLSMSFDSKCLGESIVYDSESDSLTITQIPNALKSRLLKHLQAK